MTTCIQRCVRCISSGAAAGPSSVARSFSTSAVALRKKEVKAFQFKFGVDPDEPPPRAPATSRHTDEVQESRDRMDGRSRDQDSMMRDQNERGYSRYNPREADLGGSRSVRGDDFEEDQAMSERRRYRTTPSDEFIDESMFEQRLRIPTLPERSSTSRRPSITDVLTPAWQDPVDPQRRFRGVHNRQKREKGLTPDESQRINKQIEQILHSMDSFDGPNSLGARDRSGSDYAPSFMGPWSYMPRRSTGLGLGGRRRILEMPETEEDEEVIIRLDELKEEMSLQTTDVELVKWAKKNVFQPIQVSTDVPGETIQSFPPVYPRILGHLLSFVRRTFNNPHLVLALFRHAQTQSPESYLNGCLAPAYNEVLKVRWESFRDLSGVEAGVKEMDTNAVGWDRATAKIVDKVVAEVSKEVVTGVGWEERYGKDVHHRLAALEARLQKDMVEQQRYYEHTLREKQKVRASARREAQGLTPRQEAPNRMLW